MGHPSAPGEDVIIQYVQYQYVHILLHFLYSHVDKYNLYFNKDKKHVRYSISPFISNIPLFPVQINIH